MNWEAVKNFRSLGKKIVCVGRNYVAHAKELGNAVPEKPVLFMKATSSYVFQGSPIKVPLGCTNLSHEVELGVVMGREAKSVDKTDAMDYVGGYALALDMTARDFQNDAKSKGLPWFLSKSFDTSCPISHLVPKEKVADPGNLKLWCKVNGELRQNGQTSDMMFSVPVLIEYISQFVSLEPGDVILTGTPEGVGQLVPGDIIECGLENLIHMTFMVEE